MRYDNPIIRNIIDDCVRKIMAESDEVLMKEENELWRWENLIRQDFREAVFGKDRCMLIGSVLELTAALSYHRDYLSEQAIRIKMEVDRRFLLQRIHDTCGDEKQ